jgi:hypothetical protein
LAQIAFFRAYIFAFTKSHKIDPQESSNIVATIDVTPATTKPRSVYECSNVIDVALFTNPEEIYLVTLVAL